MKRKRPRSKPAFPKGDISARPEFPANPSVADIRALLQAERKQRSEACLKEVQAAIQPILKKYNCESRIVSEWVIVPLDPQ